MDRLRASLREIGLGRALAGAMLLSALGLLAIWFSALHSRQEAAGQAKSGGITSIPTVTQPKALPPITVPKLPPELTELTTPESRVRGIPGLGDADVIGDLRYFGRGNDFRCSGPQPDRGLTKQVCSSPSANGNSTVYEVKVVEKSPGTVLAVVATAYDVSEGEATDFLSYVAKLSLEDTDPINTRSWVEGNISSGGQYLAEGAQLKLYGTGQARTLEIVAV